MIYSKNKKSDNNRPATSNIYFNKNKDESLAIKNIELFENNNHSNTKLKNAWTPRPPIKKLKSSKSEFQILNNKDLIINSPKLN